MIASPSRFFAAVAIASSAALTLSGCAVVEDLLPEEEQRTVDVFEREPSGTFEGSEPDFIPEDSDGSTDGTDSVEEPTDGNAEEGASPEENADIESSDSEAAGQDNTSETSIDNVGAAFDYLDEITALATNTCTTQNLLGSTTRVAITNTESAPDPYTILFIPESKVDDPEIRAIAYYPESSNNLSPELLQNHNAHACGLAAYYPSTFTELLADKELTDPLPSDMSLTKTGNRYTISLPDGTHLLATNQGLITQSSIIKTDATTTRDITHIVSDSDVTLFEGLAKYLRTLR
jgi:hypothetical protein